MPRTLGAILTAICLTVATLIAATLTPRPLVANDRPTVKVVTSAPRIERTPIIRARATSDRAVLLKLARRRQRSLALAIRYARARLVDEAIEWASGLHQAEHAVHLVANHGPVVPTTGGDYTSWPDWPLWRCTAFHESGGLFWTNEAGPYSGPFDIARTTWRAFGGWVAARWPDAATAPPADQIIGARLVRAAVGSSEWGGLRACGG